MGDNRNLVQLPPAYRAYGVVIYWISIVAALICTLAPIVAFVYPSRNVLNPQFLFSTIWEGKTPEAVWQTVGGGFPGGHFWLNNLGYGDGLIQFGLALGCSCAGIALLGTAVAYLREKPRSYGWALLCLLISTLIALAALGVYQQGA